MQWVNFKSHVFVSWVEWCNGRSGSFIFIAYYYFLKFVCFLGQSMKIWLFWGSQFLLWVKKTKKNDASNTRSYKLNSVVPSTLQNGCFDEYNHSFQFVNCWEKLPPTVHGKLDCVRAFKLNTEFNIVTIFSALSFFFFYSSHGNGICY